MITKFKIIKYSIAILITMFLTSCHSHEARTFRNEIDSAEQRAFRILVGDTSEGARLRALINKKPDVALNIAVKQRRQLQDLMSQIAKMDVSKIPKAMPLQNSAVSYYKSLLRLKDLDIIEAKLLQVASGRDTVKAQKAKKILETYNDKHLNLNDSIIQAAKKKSHAQEIFSEANKLD